MGFPGGSDGKASACNEGDLGSIPGSGRSTGERNGNPLQDSCLENSMDGGAWWARVHRVEKSPTRLNDFTSLLVFLPGEFHGQRSLEGYSPWGHRVGHDWVTNTFHFDFHASTLLSSNYILKHISKKTENLCYESICTWISIGTL